MRNQLFTALAQRVAIAFAIVLVAFTGQAEAGVAIGVAGFTTGGTGTDNLQEAMKVYFQESVVNNVVTDSELLDIFEQDTNVQEERTGGGRYIETAQMFGYNAGYGHRSERDYIPVPDGPIIKNGRIYLKKALGSVEMTADTFEKVKKGKEAFVTWAEQAMPRLVERMVNEKDRIMLGFGAAVKARAAGLADATDPDRVRLELKDAYGIAGYDEPWLAFLEGERLVFGPNIDGTQLRGGAERSARLLDIDDFENTLILDRDPGIAADDYIFPGDNSGTSAMDNGVPREFMGLHGHVDDGGIIAEYLGIARADHRMWRGLVIDAQGEKTPGPGHLSEELLTYANQQVAVRGGGQVDTIVVPVSGAFQFWVDLKTDRALNDPSSFTGGHGKLNMLLGSRSAEVRSARKLPPQAAFLLQRGTFKRFTLGKFEWDDRTGSIWKQVVDSQGRLDAFWAYGREYEELACQQPRRNVRIDNISPSWGVESA
jgi:hypothetical protein